MNKSNILLELNELKDQGFINSFNIENNLIYIKTLESISLVISTDFISFYKLDKSSEEKHLGLVGNIYESFEQLLSHLSNEYNVAFNKKLYDKLLLISEAQNDNNKEKDI